MRVSTSIAAFALAMLAGGHAGQASATTGFTGELAPMNWTTTVSGPGFGALVNANAAPTSVTLVGGNDASGVGCPDGTLPGFIGNCHIDYTIAGNRTYGFQWSYATTDVTPQYDPFGVIVDGVRIELVANGGDVFQSGSFSVHANSTFGFYVNCTDCTFGGATATLSNITAVPEPATMALIALGLPMLLLARRRRG